MPWHYRRPGTDSSFAPGIARGIRPLVSPRRLDPVGLAGAFGVQQFPVALAIVDRFRDGLDGEPIFPGYLFRRERLRADGLAVKDFRPDAAVHEELPVV